MLTAWSNFAKYSDPNGANGGDWKPYTAENQQFMRFSFVSLIHACQKYSVYDSLV
jgi:carboxylesterase type B